VAGGGGSLPEEQPLARSCFPFRNRALSHLPGKAFVFRGGRRAATSPFLLRSCKHIIDGAHVTLSLSRASAPLPIAITLSFFNNAGEAQG